MNNEREDSLQMTLNVYRLPEDASAQQALIERAEEDLLCALSLYRKGVCGYLPLVTVCFLLHQAVEKWLKVLIAVKGITVNSKQHDLYSRLEALMRVDSAFEEVKLQIEAANIEIMDHKFPGNLRYSETSSDIEQYINTLMKAAFAVRKIAKRHFNS